MFTQTLVQSAHDRGARQGQKQVHVEGIALAFIASGIIRGFLFLRKVHYIYLFRAALVVFKWFWDTHG